MRIRDILCLAAAKGAVALLALGCGNQATWARNNTVGHVGCSKNEIRITDIDADGYQGATSWTAWCGDQAYYCQNWQQGALVDTDQRGTTCTPALATSGGAAPRSQPTAGGPDQGVSSSRDPKTGAQQLRVRVGIATVRMALDGDPARDPTQMRMTLARTLREGEASQACSAAAFVADGAESKLPAQVSRTAFKGEGGADWEALALMVQREQARVFERSFVTIRACDFSLRLNGEQTAMVRAFLQRWDATPRDPNLAPPASTATATAAPPDPATPVPALPAQAGPNARPATGGGCQYDLQCKGDRVCVAGACVSPAAAAEVPAEAGTK